MRAVRHPSRAGGQRKYFPLIRHLTNFGLFEVLVAAGEALGEQLGHHGLLHDLELVDHGLARLDGVVHRRQNGRDLPLLGEGR